jgi:hypothetical protein
MPTTLGIAIAIATPLLSFFAVLLGQQLTRRSAKELEVWRRREETMRMLRWCAESASSENPALRRAGVAVLEGLTESELLQAEDHEIVRSVAAISVEMAYRAGRRERYDSAQDVLADDDVDTSPGKVTARE